MYRAQGREVLLNLVNTADLVTPVKERVTGIDLMLRLCERGARENWRVFLLGAAPGVAEEAAEKLKNKYPGLVIAGTHDGYFKREENDRIVKMIRSAEPHILFVALGMPKQEQWIAEYQHKTGVPVAIGVGGSFDVISGRKKRAPGWTQRLKVEWLYRLIKESWRIKRQLVLPKFALLVLRKYLLK
ncbi:MAG: WecB/TagA/CpsF family glycosyltransferase [Desulfotomaculum sp.]|nr:WecB/TagA/CpsF family glycosyltransferase [Desulfotomaculum sp.]